MSYRHVETPFFGKLWGIAAARDTAMIPSGRRSARLQALHNREDLAASGSTTSTASHEAEISKSYKQKQKRLPASALQEAIPVQDEALQNEEEEQTANPRLWPGREMEERLWRSGYKLVAGVDEAGRGPLAGPVVAAACVIPEHVQLCGIDDSKRMTALQRELAYSYLLNHPDVTSAVSVIHSEEIDEVNILRATLRAMERAVAGLGARNLQPDFVLIDGNQRPMGIDAEKSELVVKGDSKSHVIAAASIIAKVARDRLMLDYDKQWPVYKFAQHKGYGTALHLAALKEHGPCPIHRRSYAPVALAAAAQSEKLCANSAAV